MQIEPNGTPLFQVFFVWHIPHPGPQQYQHQQRFVREEQRSRSCRLRPKPCSRYHGVFRDEARAWGEGGRRGSPRVAPSTLHGCSGASEEWIKGETK